MEGRGDIQTDRHTGRQMVWDGEWGIYKLTGIQADRWSGMGSGGLRKREKD